MWSLLLAAALTVANSLDPMLDQLDAPAPEPVICARLVPSRLDADVLWMPYDAPAKGRGEGHWIPPLRLGIAEKSWEDWPAEEGTEEFLWSDQLERVYYLPHLRCFASQQLPFCISAQVEASRNGDQGCSLQVELSTTVVSDARAIAPAVVRIRTRQAEGQLLPGQSLVISNLYPFEEVLPVLGDLPVLGALFQLQTTGPMLVLTPSSS